MMAKNNIVVGFHTYPSFSTLWVLYYHQSLFDICNNTSKFMPGPSDIMAIKLLNIFKTQNNKTNRFVPFTSYSKGICSILISNWHAHLTVLTCDSNGAVWPEVRVTQLAALASISVTDDRLYELQWRFTSYLVDRSDNACCNLLFMLM